MLSLEHINAEIANVVAHGDNRNDVLYLASLFTCRSGLAGEDARNTPSSDALRMYTVETGEDSAFMKCVNGHCYADVLSVINELMDTIHVLNPRLYDGVIRKLQE